MISKKSSRVKNVRRFAPPLMAALVVLFVIQLHPLINAPLIKLGQQAAYFLYEEIIYLNYLNVAIATIVFLLFIIFNTILWAFLFFELPMILVNLICFFISINENGYKEALAELKLQTSKQFLKYIPSKKSQS